MIRVTERITPEPVKPAEPVAKPAEPVRQASNEVSNNPDPVRQAKEPASPKSKVRASKESWNTYHAELMRRRRAAAKADKIALASADP
jgi:hypothetical protein